MTIAVMVSLFCYSLYLIPHLGAIFMPPLEEDTSGFGRSSLAPCRVSMPRRSLLGCAS